MNQKLRCLQKFILLSSLFAPDLLLGAQVDLLNNQTVGGGAPGDPAVGDWVVFRNDVILGVGTGGAADLAASPTGSSVEIDGLPPKGTLNFLGNSSVPGQVGAPGANLKAISIDPGIASSITFNQNIYVSEDATYGKDGQTINVNSDAEIRKFNFNNTNSTLNLGPGVTINGQIDNAIANNGVLNFIDSPVLNTTTTVIGKIGNTQPLNVVKIGANTKNGVTAYLQEDAKATQFELASKAILKLAPNLNISGKIVAGGVGGGLGRGNLFLENNAILNNNVEVNKIEINAGVGEFADIATFNGTTVRPGATLQVKNGANLFTTVEGQGNIKTVGGATFFRKIGNITPIDTIEINTITGGFKSASFADSVIANRILVFGNGINPTTIEFGNNSQAIVETKFNNQNIIRFNGAAPSTHIGDVGALGKIFSKVEALAKNDMTLSGNLWAQELFLGGNNTLRIVDGFNLHAITTTKTVNEGVISFLGDSIVEGQVGSALLPLREISTTGAGKVQFDSNLYATDISILNTSSFIMSNNNKLITANIATGGGGSTFNIADHKLDLIGNLLIAPNDTFAIDLTSGSKGLLNVTGNVTTTSGLGGTILSVNTGSPVTGYVPSQEVDIIKASAAGTLKTIDRVIEFNPSAILSFKTVVLPDGLGEKLRLLVLRNSTLNLLNINPGPQLEQAAAEGRLTPALSQIMTELQNLDTDDEIANALRSLGPNLSSALIENTIQGFSARTDVVFRRLEVARMDRTGYSAGDNISDQKGIWGAFLARHFHDKQITEEYEANYFQPIFGLERNITDQWILGAALAYGLADIKYNLANSNVDVKSAQLFGYGSWDLESWFADGVLGFGYNRYDQQRNILLPGIKPASAVYYASEISTKLRFGHETLWNYWGLSKSISFKLTNLFIDEYTEMGSDAANLKVKNDNIHIITLGGGVKLQYFGAVFTPEFRAAYYHDLLRDRQKTHNSFVDSTVVFDLDGYKKSSSSYELGIGVASPQVNNLKLNINYDFNFRSQFRSHSLFAKLRYEWT
ncbi:MAG: autotransporter domain-containing protein [Gammaproteobacteria bacterium]